MDNSRISLHISLENMEYNFKQIQSQVAPAKVMAVLKANGYGLGCAPLAASLIHWGVDRIGLAEVKEAQELHQYFLENQGCIPKVPLHILGALLPNEVPQAVRLNLVCPVGDYNTALLLSQEAQKQNCTVRVHFLLDTGMGRLGIPASPIKHTLDTLEKCLLLPHLEFEGIYSHFANANYLEDSKTQEQIAYFENILEKLDHPFSLVHLSNSDGIQNFPHSYGSPYNMVRTGINLYGVFDLEGEKNIQLKPTLSLHSKLIAKRQLPAGATIGYGGTHVLSKETWVGTIPAGYADGVPMEVGNKGQVLVKGHFCPIIGKVSMDYITIDLSLYPEAEIGEDVILIGRAENTEEITVEDWARLKGSHPYDVICSLGKRVERIYL